MVFCLQLKRRRFKMGKKKSKKLENMIAVAKIFEHLNDRESDRLALYANGFAENSEYNKNFDKKK